LLHAVRWTYSILGGGNAVVLKGAQQPPVRIGCRYWHEWLIALVEKEAEFTADIHRQTLYRSLTRSLKLT
jgi:hypothetical protein